MSLREKCTQAGAEAMERVAQADEAEQVSWEEMVEVGFDAILAVLAEHADEIPATVTQRAWKCPNCGTDHGGPGCGEELPVVWSAFTMEQLLAVLAQETNQ